MAEKSSHCVYEINYHFVWTPKYRRSFLYKVKSELENWISEICDEYDYGIISLHISPDHIHLFVSASPSCSPASIIRTIKSITSRRLWDDKEKLMEEYFWDGGCWENSYYVGTTGSMSSETVKNYIERNEHI